MSLALVDLHAGTMVTADLGDSHTFLGMQNKDGEVNVSKLSHKHSPSDKSERQRIEEAGGEVHYEEGAHRIGTSRNTLIVSGVPNLTFPHR